MSLKDKILNRIADRLKDYRTPEYDTLLSCNIKCEVKGAFMTTDCTTIKELTKKSQRGLLDINKLLEEELDIGETYHRKEIIFCDCDNVVCIYNSKNNTYYEDVHECFENAEERVYIKCDNSNEYQLLKYFVNQSSKYHKFVKYENEVPAKRAFETIFDGKRNTIGASINEKSKKRSYDNYVEITGQVLNIGKKFIKKDGSKAQFIEIQQEYEYNDKIKHNRISVMLSSDLIDNITDMRENNIISIKGKLSTYNDKNNNLKSIINCSEIEILEKKEDRNNNVEMER